MNTRKLLLFLALALVPICFSACGEDDPATPGTGGGGDSGDITPPSAITDLHTDSPTTGSIALVWTAPGDDGQTGTATAYDVRYGTAEITEQNWQSAMRVDGEPPPKACGEIETIRVTNLESATRYFFAIKTSDEVPNVSDLSNCVCDTTEQESAPPAAIADLSAQHMSATSFLLTWTAPGDDGDIGTASAYDVRYSTGQITDQNWEAATPVADVPPPKPAGSPDSLLVTGLTVQQNYFFAIRTADEVPNWSGLSNETPALALGNRLWVYPLSARTGESITIVYRRAHSGTTALHAHYRDETDQWVMIEADGPWPPGIYIRQWDFRDIHDEYHVSPYGPYTIKLLWNLNLKAEVQVRLDP